jgi:transcriptional regulator GlxA family with amidase domain
MLNVPHDRGQSAPADTQRSSAERLQWATALLTAGLEERLSVDEVVKASGFSERTLYRLIQTQQGTSPAALRRRTRLEAAHAELTAPGPGTTVTSVAVRFGFHHLGRFSRDYSRAFGELPSRTLSRARCP